VRASADEHSDLFWAVRGGGGNFGVATWLEYELYPVGPMVIGGLVAHPFTAARDVLRFYRDFTRSLPDDLTRSPASCTPRMAQAPRSPRSWCVMPESRGRGGGGGSVSGSARRAGRDRTDAVLGPSNMLFDAASRAAR